MTTCNLRFRVWQRRGSGRWGKRPFDGDRYAGEPVTPASMAVALLGLLVALAIADCTEAAVAVGVWMLTSTRTLPGDMANSTVDGPTPARAAIALCIWSCTLGVNEETSPPSSRAKRTTLMAGGEGGGSEGGGSRSGGEGGGEADGSGCGGEGGGGDGDGDGGGGEGEGGGGEGEGGGGEGEGGGGKGGNGGGGGGGAGHVETGPETPSVRVVGQKQTAPPESTWTLGPWAGVPQLCKRESKQARRHFSPSGDGNF